MSRARRGQSTVEYVLIVTFAAITVIVLMVALSPQIADLFLNPSQSRRVQEGRVSTSAAVYD